MAGQSSATKPDKLRRRSLLVAALVLLLLAGSAGRFWWRRHAALLRETTSPSTAPADPRLVYNGPFRNIRPHVRYVGDAECVLCHADIAHSYAQHPMGRSLVPVQALLDRQRYTSETNNPFTLLGRRFKVDRQGDHLWHRQSLFDDSGKPLVELAEEVRWVIGSGAKGYSYLNERDGYVFQTPISWFTRRQRWDLSPGYGPAVMTGRLVPASCLFCHANGLLEHPQHRDRFLGPVFAGQSIGCERCHGPGESHAKTGDGLDIVNPERLQPELRDAVCEQCHLEGLARLVRGGRQLFDYRPGLPLHDFWAVLVEDRSSGENAKAVSHVEQMYQSKCFSRPVGGVKMGCVTCHDPHVHIGPEKRQVEYRSKCLLCHGGTKGPHVCSEPLAERLKQSPRDSCIDCHMPRYRHSDIAHAASTDHRIVRRPMDQPIRAANLENAVLVDFYRDRFPQGDPQAERTLGLGLLKMIGENTLQPRRQGERVLQLLESALARDPSDAVVREGKVEAYLLTNRREEALSEADFLLREQPGLWQVLVQAASAAQAERQWDRARDYWRQAVKINPVVPIYQARLMESLLRTGEVEEARDHCEKLLRLDPFNVTGRQTRVGFLLQQGKQAEAIKEFDLIRRLKPPDLAQREERFQQQLRSVGVHAP